MTGYCHSIVSPETKSQEKLVTFKRANFDVICQLTRPQRLAYKVTFLEIQTKQDQHAEFLSNIQAMELKIPGFAQSFFCNNILSNFLYQMGNLVSAPRSRPQIVHHGFHDRGGNSMRRVWEIVEKFGDEAEANAQLARDKLKRRRQRYEGSARQPNHRGQ